MKELKELLTIEKEFYFNGHVYDLRERIKNLKDVNYNFFNDQVIKFSPNISWGTLMISNGAGVIDGINVRAFVSDIDGYRLRMNIKTTVRPEHYFIIVMFAFLLIASSLGDNSRLLTIYVVGLWIVCHICFQFLYRFQENKLIDKVVTNLNLSTI